MQNYFAEKTKPVISDKQQAIANVTDSLKKIQKNEYLTKSIRSMYKEKNDFNQSIMIIH